VMIKFNVKNDGFSFIVLTSIQLKNIKTIFIERIQLIQKCSNPKIEPHKHSVSKRPNQLKSP
jgi:hypothetical protein